MPSPHLAQAFCRSQDRAESLVLSWPHRPIHNSVTRRPRCFHIMLVYYHNFNLTWNLNRGVAGTSRIYSRFYNKLYDYASNNNGEEVCGCAATRPSSESLLHEWLCSFRWNGDGIRGRNLYSLLGTMGVGNIKMRLNVCLLRRGWMDSMGRGAWEGEEDILAPKLGGYKIVTRFCLDSFLWAQLFSLSDIGI